MISIGIRPPFCPKCGSVMLLYKVATMEEEDEYTREYRLVFECDVERKQRLDRER